MANATSRRKQLTFIQTMSEKESQISPTTCLNRQLKLDTIYVQFFA